MKFSMDIIAAVQKTCGRDFPIIFKYTPDHFTDTEGSRKLPEGIEMAKMFEEAGVAALHIDKGCYDVWYEVIPNVYMPDGNQVDLAKEIKKVVNIPIITHGKLGDPKVAESVLENGYADFIGLGHTSICEPHWVNKVKAGKFDDLRPCIGCNECVANISVDRDSSCAINPLNGVEKEYPLIPVTGKKKILIIGGGPAGMQAALTAAERGIEVEIWEESETLGGLLKAAGAPSFKNDVKKYTKYLITQVNKAKINVILNKKAKIHEIEKGSFDCVILSAGAKSIVPPINGIDGENVMNSTDVLLGKAIPGQKSVVIGGGLVGCETALSIIRDQGKEATVIEMQEDILTTGVFLNNALKLREMIRTSHLETICGASVTKIDKNGINYSKAGKEGRISCDSVILACGYYSNNSLEKELEDNTINYRVIGDCAVPGKIYDAVHQGFHMVRVLFDEPL